MIMSNNKNINLKNALTAAASSVKPSLMAKELPQVSRMSEGALKHKCMMRLLLKHQDSKTRSRIRFYAAGYLGYKMQRLNNIRTYIIDKDLQKAIDKYIDKYHICKHTSHNKVCKIEEFGELFGIKTEKLVSTTHNKTNWHKAKEPWQVLSLSVRPLTRREIVKSLKENTNGKITNNKIKQNLNPRGNVNFVPSSLTKNQNQNKFLGYAVDLLKMMAKETNTNTRLKRQEILYDLLKRLKTEDDIQYFLRQKLNLLGSNLNKKS